MDNIVYRINTKIVSKKEFETTVNSHSRADFIKEKIKERGVCYVEAPKRKSYAYDCFYCAHPDVFKMEKIIEDNEYDPLDGDAFNVAYALHEAGFGLTDNISKTTANSYRISMILSIQEMQKYLEIDDEQAKLLYHHNNEVAKQFGAEAKEQKKNADKTKRRR